MMFGHFGGSLYKNSVIFVSQAFNQTSLKDQLGINKLTESVVGNRKISKDDMLLNNYTPAIEVDPETYEVTADGEILTCEPATELPMAQRYFLF